MRKRSIVLVIVLFLQTLAKPALTLSSPLVSEENLIEKEEVAQKELETQSEEEAKESEELPKEVNEILNEEKRLEEVPEEAKAENKDIEELLSSSIEKETKFVDERTNVVEVKKEKMITTGRNGTVDWVFDSDKKELVFTSTGKLLTPIHKMDSGTLVETIIFQDVVDLPEDSSHFFGAGDSLNRLALRSIEGLDKVRTSDVIRMDTMFFCTDLEELDLSKFNTSNVTTMLSMFADSFNLKLIKFGEEFVTENVINMENMFSNTALEELDLSGFNTFNVTDMSTMFARTPNLNSIKFGEEFNTEKVTRMYGMFLETALKKLELSDFNTSNVTDMRNMFYFTDLEELDLSNFNTSKIINMSRMFAYSRELRSIKLSDEFNTENVETMYEMFYLTGVEELDLSNFNTSKVINMSRMFASSFSLKSIKFGDKFYTDNVTDMAYMFSNLQSLEGLDVSNFNTSKVTDMSQMFANLYSIEELDLSSFDTSKVTRMQDMFAHSRNLKRIKFGEAFDTRNVANTSDMFLNDRFEEITFGDKFKLNGNRGLGNPEENLLYTGRWVARDGVLVYDTSSDLLINDANKRGLQTFVWQRRLQPDYLITTTTDEVTLTLEQAEQINDSIYLLTLFGAEVFDRNVFNLAPQFVPISEATIPKTPGKHRILLEVEDPGLPWDLTDYNRPELKKEVTLQITPTLGTFPTFDPQPKYELLVEKETVYLSPEEANKITDSEILSLVNARAKDLNLIVSSPNPRILRRNKTEKGFSAELGIENPHKQRLTEQTDRTDYSRVYQQVDIILLSLEENEKDKEKESNEGQKEKEAESNEGQKEKEKENIEANVENISHARNSSQSKENLPKTGEKSEIFLQIVGQALIIGMFYVVMSIKKRRRKRV